MLFSLLAARFATPPLAAYFLKPSKHPQEKKPLGGFYRISLDWALHHKWLSALLGGVVFFASIFLAGLLPTGFQPVADSGYFYLDVQGPPGADRVAMDKAIQQATRMILKQPDVQAVFAQVGSSAGGGGFGVSSGDDLRDGTITVVLNPHRAHSTDGVKRLIRPMLRNIPDVRINTQGSFGAADVNIILGGDNTANLDKAQLELEKEMRGLKQISDVRPSPSPPGPELEIRPKPTEAARLGVNAFTLASILRIATIGDIDANVAKYSEGERRIPIRVRLSDSDRGDLSAIKRLQAPIAGGKTAPLDSVADLSFQAGPAKIIRYQRRREAIVEADLHGATLGTALAAVRQLPIMKHLPPA